MAISRPLSWKIKTVFAVIAVVAIMSVGLIYTQPWSRIKVVYINDLGMANRVAVYIDGEQLKWVDCWDRSNVVGVWGVVAGSHSVGIDATGVLGTFDGTIDVSYTVKVGLLSTQKVVFGGL